MISQVCSGDILQFGVDVMENSRKVQMIFELIIADPFKFVILCLSDAYVTFVEQF